MEKSRKCFERSCVNFRHWVTQPHLCVVLSVCVGKGQGTKSAILSCSLLIYLDELLLPILWPFSASSPSLRRVGDVVFSDLSSPKSSDMIERTGDINVLSESSYCTTVFLNTDVGTVDIPFAFLRCSSAWFCTRIHIPPSSGVPTRSTSRALVFSTFNSLSSQIASAELGPSKVHNDNACQASLSTSFLLIVESLTASLLVARANSGSRPELTTVP
uniref:Uncharacterized protein n=1 Tax=Steinernema glaseri TaxID=37863 RepID=A0A1I7ZF81_9BILA